MTQLPAINPDIVVAYDDTQDCPWTVSLEYLGGDTVKLEPNSIFIEMDIPGESNPCKVSLSRIAHYFQLAMGTAYMDEWHRKEANRQS